MDSKTIEDPYTVEIEQGECIELARATLNSYVRKQRRVEEGCLSSFMHRGADVMTRLETDKRNRLRGESERIGSGSKLSQNIIESVIDSASDSEISPAVSPSELSNINVSIMIPRSINLVSSPEEYITPGENVPIIQNVNPHLIYPTIADRQDWSSEEYLTMTCKKAQREPDWWKEIDLLPVMDVNVFEEIKPGGGVRSLTDTPHMLE